MVCAMSLLIITLSFLSALTVQAVSISELDQIFSISSETPLVAQKKIKNFFKDGCGKNLSWLQGISEVPSENSFCSSDQHILKIAVAVQLPLARPLFTFSYDLKSQRLLSIHNELSSAKLCRTPFVYEVESKPDLCQNDAYTNHASTSSKENDKYTYLHIGGPGGNVKTGKYYYGKDLPPLRVRTKDGKTCFMENENVITIDMNHDKPARGAENTHPVYSFPCGDHHRKEINGAYSPINDAHYFGTAVFRMYKDWYGVHPLKEKLILRVHYGHKLDEAYWDGTHKFQVMTFGDGNKRFYPTTSLNVIAHEVSHGFTQENSGLRTRIGEYGSINEAFSDMAGEALEYYLYGKNDFIVADGLTKNTPGLRYMADPPDDGVSAGHIDNYNWEEVCKLNHRDFPKQCHTAHQGAGIYNKAFYLIATSKGWNTKKAFDIFVRANQKYWHEFTEFQDGAEDVLKATKDLGYPAKDVISAFAAVGIQL